MQTDNIAAFDTKAWLIWLQWTRIRNCTILEEERRRGFGWVNKAVDSDLCRNPVRAWTSPRFLTTASIYSLWRFIFIIIISFFLLSAGNRNFCFIFSFCCEARNGTYSQSFAPNCLRGEQIGALFNSHSFCTVVVNFGSLEGFNGRKKGQLCSAIAFGSSLGALQKRIHVNLSWSPQQQRVFEETFTDWLWRLVRHVEDSLNSAGLLASTTLLLMPACKSNGWSPFRLQTPHIK